MSKDLLTAQEVAFMIGVSVPTLTSWYKFKTIEPTNELCKLLPEYQQAGSRSARYWHKSDVWKLIEFKQRIPIGRNGLMGKVTQKYVKK